MTRSASLARTALYGRAARGRALIVAGIAAVLTVVLALALHDTGSTTFDQWALVHSKQWIGDGAASVLLQLSSPSAPVTVITAVVLVALLTRRRRLAVIGVAGPVLTVGLTEYVLKPIVGRYLVVDWLPRSLSRTVFGNAFPSGHESGVAAAAVVLVLAVVHVTHDRRWRIGVGILAPAWTILAAIGLVRSFYHYATDTVGSIMLSVAVVLGAALAVDAIADRRR